MITLYILCFIVVFLYTFGACFYEAEWLNTTEKLIVAFKVAVLVTIFMIFGHWLDGVLK